MIFVDEKDQPRLSEFDRAIVFHLGDREVAAGRDGAVAIGENAEIDIGILDHAQRGFDGILIERGEVLHHLSRLETGA